MVHTRATEEAVLVVLEPSTGRGRGQAPLANAPLPPPPHPPIRDSSYSDLLVTHPPLFSKATDLLEADNWLCTIESMFGLLHCIEYQKTLYATEQL
jgi:hypothetical protein